MQARDVMVSGIISVGPDIPVQIAANAMVSNCVSALPVIDIHAKLVGIISEGDLIRRVEIGTERRPSGGAGETQRSSDSLAKEFVRSRAKRVSDVMTREVITAPPETSLREIANMMERHSIKRVPIVEDERVVGIVSRANLLQILARANDTDWVESDRVLHQRFVDSIKDQPWAGRPFNIIVNDRRADLWGFVYSVEEKTAVRVAAEATPGIESVADHLGIAPQASGT
ncbi:CBS domain-containing protein [Bradyrhizobium sp.]|uniref:CBS domain-containing protein n=1 Tax=Bradyrhizobium sp. TaxID=376 RepID=UPI002D17F40C|nr:CBS domain-containing protein [Bradyrhizobium sp.]HMM88035.1 CBS domain-containing protein [Bradyrhizobium sp.]